MEKKLISEKDGQISAKKILIFRDVEHMRILANPVAWRIMELLSKDPMYPAQVARELKIYEQSAYYYIRKLVSIRAVEEVGKNFVRGGTARLYHTSSPSFGIEMDWWGETKFLPLLSPGGRHTSASKFFEDFIIGKEFAGLLVVGSPEPHGPYRILCKRWPLCNTSGIFLGPYYKVSPFRLCSQTGHRRQGGEDANWKQPNIDRRPRHKHRDC